MLTMKRVFKAGVARASRISAWIQTKGGGRSQHCNSCQSDVAKFYIYGGRPFGCPLCRSSTRERFVIELIDRGVLPISDSTQSVLHVAPSEKGVIRRLEKIRDYHPVDLFPELYPATKTQSMDLMKLDAVDRYDLVYLSHVMEHVPDDLHVYRGLFRALKNGGEAWILVPLWDQPTVDGNPEMTGQQREKMFGQWDHARQYGPDLKERMESCGFRTVVIKASDLDASIVQRLGLQGNDWVFRGSK